MSMKDILDRVNPNQHKGIDGQAMLSAVQGVLKRKDDLAQQKIQNEKDQELLDMQKADHTQKMVQNLHKMPKAVRSKMLPAFKGQLSKMYPGMREENVDMLVQALDDSELGPGIAHALYNGTATPEQVDGLLRAEGGEGWEILRGLSRASGSGDDTLARQMKLAAWKETNIDRPKEERTKTAEEAKTLEKEVTDFSKQVEKQGLPELFSQMKKIDSLIDGGIDDPQGDIPGYGKTALAPDFMTSEKGRELRKAASGLRNAILKARSGGAVTDGEADRMLEEMGMSGGIKGALQFRSDVDLAQGLRGVRDTLASKLSVMSAGRRGEVLTKFNERQMGLGMQPLDLNDPIFAKATLRSQAPEQKGAPPALNKMNEEQKKKAAADFRAKAKANKFSEEQIQQTLLKKGLGGY